MEHCIYAAKIHGFSFNRSTTSNHWDPKHHLDGCFLHSWLELPDLPITLPEEIDGRNNLVVLNKKGSCDSSLFSCNCSLSMPCFCSTNFFVERDPKIKNRRTQVGGQFVVTWSLSLGGQESLLEESDFLRAGFEQSVKDYINNDIRCSDNINIKGAEFFGVQIETGTEEQRIGRKRAVSGNGKCKGDVIKCRKGLKSKGRSDRRMSVVKLTDDDDEFCDKFLKSTIFDSFEERLLIASTFNYNVDVDTIASLEGSLELKYDVSFEPGEADGLNKVEDVDMDAEEPKSINPKCTASQCLSQREVMKKIFFHFDLIWDENKHECLYEGINCDTDDLVTHIWFGEYFARVENVIEQLTENFTRVYRSISFAVNYDFKGKVITPMFGSLPSLQGLFLGTSF